MKAEIEHLAQWAEDGAFDPNFAFGQALQGAAAGAARRALLEAAGVSMPSSGPSVAAHGSTQPLRAARAQHASTSSLTHPLARAASAANPDPTPGPKFMQTVGPNYLTTPTS